MTKSIGYMLLLAAQLASAGPIGKLLHTIEVNGVKDIVWPKDRPQPVHLTYTPSGQKIAWVHKDAQLGGAPLPKPPKIAESHLAKVEKNLHAELDHPKAERGPAGTVPFMVLTKEEYERVPKKQPSPYFSGHKNKKIAKRDNPHYYGNSGQTITNYGGSCVLSLFNPTVQGGGSESLIQVAVENSQGGGGAGQTAESGWQVEPALNGDNIPHIFTYFTTDGYQSEGDYVGGYNALQAGWVQTDSSQYPGFTFSEFSTVGGQQFETPLGYSRHDDGNWWLTVNGVTMGYLNGSMYAASGSPSLNDNSDVIQFYGEVADASAPPTSQMGSGQFAETGSGNSAYINNMEVITDQSGTTAAYNGGSGQATDTSCYTIDANPDNTDSRGSYMFVGGPGCPT